MKIKLLQTFLAVAIVNCCVSVSLAAEEYSIQQFNQLKRSWRELSSKKTRLEIEGRYSSISRGRLRFHNCELPFQSSDGKDFPKFTGKSKVIQVTGTLEVEKGKLVFLVKRIRQLPNDLSKFRTDAGNIRANKPQPWYALGDWAAKRSAFYEDSELAETAREAYLKGVKIERAAQSAKEPDGLFTLAAKVKRFGLPESLRFSLLHEGLQRKWVAVIDKKPEDRKTLAERIRLELPGSAVPLKSLDATVAAKYASNPVKVYDAADERARRTLHRIFYSRVLLKDILADANSEGSNGYAVAAKIDEQLPEQHALAESYRDKELAFKQSKISLLTRQEALDLSKRFRERNQPRKADETLKRWLLEKTEQVRKEGPAGLPEVADWYVSLLKDKKTAGELLKEAYKANPKSKEIGERLARLGYQLRDGKWLSPAGADSQPTIQRKTSDRRVANGMSPEQVQQVLGKPKSITRIATTGKISEIWLYGDRSTSRLVIHFQRRSRAPRADAKVVSIAQIQPR